MMTTTDAVQPSAFPKQTEFHDAVAEMCLRVPASVGAGLAKALVKLSPQFFHDVLTRGGWYRLGGVIDRAGDFISSDLGQWAESEP